MNFKNILEQNLKSQFGYNNYKNAFQKEAAEAIYEGKNNIYICMPSGYGKSLCYQLPIFAKNNSFAIVISPQVAYAMNQVNNLKGKNMLSYSWNGDTPTKMKIRIAKDMISNKPKMKLLYITPEQCTNSYFYVTLMKIKPNKLSYFVFDEAHCLSRLSHDFKYSYNELINELRTMNFNIPIITITSTATKEVEEDIMKKLDMKNPIIYKIPVFRSNLFYDSWLIDNLRDPFVHLKDFIKESLGKDNILLSKEKRNCGIIYCETREKTEYLAQTLTFMGIPTLFYHNHLKIPKRLEIQRLWISGEVTVLAITNNFRFNKKSVRFVVHWGAPKSIGHYYQESDRAGHDGLLSYCRIYYDSSQLKIGKFMQIEKKLNNMKCRHAIFSKYFEDQVFECKKLCDVCDYKNVEDCTILQTNWKQYMHLISLFRKKKLNQIVSKQLIMGQSADVQLEKIKRILYKQDKRTNADIQLDKIKKILYKEDKISKRTKINLQLQSIKSKLYLKSNVKKVSFKIVKTENNIVCLCKRSQINADLLLDRIKNILYKKKLTQEYIFEDTNIYDTKIIKNINFKIKTDDNKSKNDSSNQYHRYMHNEKNLSGELCEKSREITRKRSLSKELNEYDKDIKRLKR